MKAPLTTPTTIPVTAAVAVVVVVVASCLLTLLPGDVHAVENTGSQSAAGSAFENGDFQEAAELFQQEIEASGPNASLLYNLGNSYYRLGKFGRAIHAYEQALVIDPNAADIRTNLKLARDELASFDADHPSTLKKWTRALSLNQWATLALASLLVIAAIVPLRIFFSTSGGKPRLRYTLAAAVLLLTIAVAVIILRKDETARAIVLTPETPVRLSPFASADVIRTLAPGRSVQVGETRGDFVHVGDGWVDRHAIAPIYRRDRDS